ncbi:MAG: GEVED domain-containing protein [Ferruginibacter sp.]
MKKLLQLLLCICLLSYAKAQTAETEPNNVWNQAKALAIGGTGTGTADLSFDEDWWKVVTPSDGKLTVDWASTNGSLIYCQVYDTLGTIVFVSNYTNASSSESVDGLAKGTYYLRFVAYYSTESTTYSFTPTFLAAPVANDAEPDSTVATALTLPLNGSVNGHIGYYFNNHRDSMDVYKVTVAQDGLLSFTITSGNGQDVYAQLYDGDGTTYFIGGYTTNTATYSKDGLAPGVYYIRIFTYYTTEFVPYTLSNTFTAPAHANDPVANETPATASTLPLNGSVTGHIGYHYNAIRDDVDWWKVTVNADGRLDYTITSDNGQNVYAQLYDGDGTTYLVGNYTSNTVTYSKDGLAPGIYYIRIATYYTYEWNSYTLSNTLTLPAQANDIGSNDIYTGGNVFALNSTTTGHIGYRYNGNIDATDWYKITTTEDGQISFTITSENNQNVYAQLYDGDGTSLLAGGYTTLTANYSKDGLAPGTYYIRIVTYYTTEFAPYTLSNTFTTIPSPNDFEPNNTRATASPLAINTTITGHTGYHYNGVRDDIDYYAITLPVDGKLSFTISSGNNQNVYAQLFDNDGTTYLAGNYTTLTASYSKDGLAAGTYYIQVQTYYTTEFAPYTLSTSLEPMTFLAETAGDNSAPFKGTLLPANTATGGHLYYYYNLQYDNTDWWKIGYDGTGTMALHIDLEQNHFNTDYPYITYNLYLDTLLAPVATGQVHAPTNTINLTGLAVGTYYLKLDQGFNTFGAYQLNAAYTEKCANVVGITSSAILAGCQGTITYSITGGLAPYTVQLYKDGSPFGSTQTSTGTITFSNLAAGSYYARSYSFGGSGQCNNVSTTTVFAAPAIPTISTGGGATTFCQGGSVTLTATAATSYLWSNGATTQSINVTASGSFTVIVYNAGGCPSAPSAATAVTVNPLPTTPTVQASGATTFCAGGTVTLTSSAATSYLWSNGATTQAITVSTAGSYTVVVKNANQCSSATSAATVVTVNALPATPTIGAGGATTFCTPGTVTLTSSAATSYLWSNGATTQAITVSASGSFTVVVKNANGCSSATSAATVVTVNPLPTVTLSQFTEVCSTDATFALSGGSPAGGTYSGTGVSGGQFNPVTAGVGSFPITYSYTNANGCTATATQSITVNNCTAPCNATASAGGPTTFCAGGSVVLTASAGASYLWNNGVTSASITVTAAGSYSVAVTNANNCTATSNTIVVTVNALPSTPTISTGGAATTFCAGGSVTLTSSSATNNVWSTGATTQSISVNAGGNYSVTVSNANGCSATSAATAVTVNPLPTVTLGQFTAVCSTDAAFALSGGSPAGGTYSGTGVNGGQFNPATAGVGSFPITYSYTNANGCTATATQSITVTNCTSQCTATATAGGATTFCAGGSVVLTASAGASYLWSNGATSASITVTAAGSYSVAVTNANNCTATSNTIVVTVNALPVTPTISAGGATTFCTGGSVTLTSSAATGNTWSNGATTASITVNASGSFTVTVKNANNCSATSAATVVTVNPLPTVTLAAFSAKCSTDAAFALTGGSPAGGSYSGTGVNAGQFNPATAGLGSFPITYSYTNANGCTATATQSITVSNCTIVCTATITASGATTFCAGGSVKLTASAGASYLWSNGATTNNITVTAGGSFTVKVTQSNGCFATSAATIVTVNALPSVPTITAGGPTTFCTPGSVTLTSSAATGNTWSNGATTASITVTTSGSYFVKVTNGSGCSATSAATIVTANNCGGGYCTANGTSKNKGYINKVKFRTINNTSGWNGGYGNFTNLTATVHKMNCYSISVTPGYVGCSNSPLYTRVWIDWNHDGDFNDAGELVFAPAGASTGTRNGSVSVPCNALSGTTRMRVEMRYDCNPSPCGTFTYGEVEDYTINVSGSTGRGIDSEIADDIILTTTFNVYPNPASNELIIQRTSNDNSTIVDANAQLQIADANGKVVTQARLTKSTEVINVSRLSNGIYFVKIISDNGIITKRIMVSH